MALIDYKLCAVCGGKVFYDANCCHSYPWMDYPDDNPAMYDQWESDGHKALCPSCFETHKVVVVERT